MNLELLAEDFSRDTQNPLFRRALQKVNTVERECQRLQDLLDNFLNFAKVRRLKLQPGNLNQQIRHVLSFFQPKAKEAKIKIVDYLAGDLPSVLLDREAFHGALLNLVLNVQEAMPNGGQLVVRTMSIPDGVALDLIDTGSGMDEETRSHIFEAFFSTKSCGTGLGLPMAKRIVEAHGGQITCQSERGRGTQFTIRLPVPARISADPVVRNGDVRNGDPGSIEKMG